MKNYLVCKFKGKNYSSDAIYLIEFEYVKTKAQFLVNTINYDYSKDNLYKKISDEYFTEFVPIIVKNILKKIPSNLDYMNEKEFNDAIDKESEINNYDKLFLGKMRKPSKTDLSIIGKIFLIESRYGRNIIFNENNDETAIQTFKATYRFSRIYFGALGNSIEYHDKPNKHFSTKNNRYLIIKGSKNINIEQKKIPKQRIGCLGLEYNDDFYMSVIENSKLIKLKTILNIMPHTIEAVEDVLSITGRKYATVQYCTFIKHIKNTCSPLIAIDFDGIFVGKEANNILAPDLTTLYYNKTYCIMIIYNNKLDNYMKNLVKFINDDCKCIEIEGNNKVYNLKEYLGKLK